MDMHPVASRQAVSFQAPAPFHEWSGRPPATPAGRPEEGNQRPPRPGWPAAWRMMAVAGQCGRILLGWAGFAILLLAGGLARL
ncbi:hypothetical protein [Paracraurococcus lichenis]|uniref:Uncharacterized protein n=1 Tax=Paracraurococcus lichenis TaxID=3064888 RepID=A0ABT9E9R5_9PROT|nr:hypothetical protein [Paracraurococcus sp. LOR1-02]MDO9712872.1 hypothetical protein [Paracraurococcus sp. LOR1-02]